MNPYSFKRFLENPGRPRHPIQLVQTGSNRIIVQGDLPDCVRNGDTGFLITDDSPQPPDLAASPYSQSSRPNVLQSIPVDNQAPTHLPDAVETRMDEDEPAVYPGPIRSRLPDIHLCTTADTRSSSHLDCRRSPLCAQPDLQIDHISPRGLPDFLPQGLVEHEEGETLIDSHRPTLASVNRHRPVQSTSLPTLLMGNVERQAPNSSKSFEQLSHGASRENTPNSTSCAIFAHGQNSDQVPTTQAVEFGGQWSTQTTPSSSQADPFVDAHPVSLSGSVTSPDPRFLTQQERIDALTMRLDETEQELRETRRILREQTQLLFSVRAESEVFRREAEVRVKALEHELAAERLRSAKDRLCAVHLRGQLASIQQNIRPTPADLSPPSSAMHSTGSSERGCSPRTYTNASSVHAHGDPRLTEPASGSRGNRRPSTPEFSAPGGAGFSQN